MPRSDQGGEFLGKAFTDFVDGKGIVHDLACPYTPQQNGMAEREMRPAIESVRTMLLHMGVQHQWWHLALRQAVWMVEGSKQLVDYLAVDEEGELSAGEQSTDSDVVEVPITKPELRRKGRAQQPPEAELPRLPTASCLHHCVRQETPPEGAHQAEGSEEGERERGEEVGAAAEVASTLATGATGSWATRVTGLYAWSIPLIRLEQLTLGRLEQRAHWRMALLGPRLPPTPSNLSLTPSLCSAAPLSPPPPPPPTATHAARRRCRRAGVQLLNTAAEWLQPLLHPPPSSTHGHHPQHPPRPPPFPPKSRSKHGCSSGDDGKVGGVGCCGEMGCAGGSKRGAMASALGAGAGRLRTHWRWHPRFALALVIGVRGGAGRWRSRSALVATCRGATGQRTGMLKTSAGRRGLLSVCGADYDETYSPVSSYVTLRIFLSIVAVLDLDLMQLDMKNALLQSKLDRVLYMALNGVLLEAGWKKSQVVEALYFKAGDNGVTCWVLVYVDDLLTASSSPAMLKELKERLEAAFEVREISPVVKYLGLEIVRDRPARKLWLHQQGYADKLRRRFIDEEQSGRVPKTPVSVDAFAELTFNDEEVQKREEEEYWQKVGSLQFAATTTRPDIAFACRNLESGLIVRSDQHWREVDSCLAYLADTRDTALEFGGGPESLKLIS
ncbi:unnamed protein product [Closterium sp. NIES-54]